MAALIDWGRVLSHVRAVLRRRGCSGQDADDLIQDAYLRLDGYQRTHEVSNPDAFLIRAAWNLAIDAHRAQRSHGETLLLDEELAQAPCGAQSASSTEDAVLSAERLTRLSLTVPALDMRTRAIFIAHVFYGMSYPEIAAVLGLSVRVVGKHVGKATAALMRRMEGW
ncbi:RNA polymerase sigma factor [Paucibacter sp. XJ19-41]|uniref:RNA polymerase sigma factor n=1 Tax=Paucibacter sp. XJ19-41 TaxID=2927824 RepID=UPI002349B4E5|nr:RNA polymerase sigma factor [Paucibacter sp. XJ19-41]MDC6167795.1 RNA polymerase sigma factor [Paucibacter sp. XJ19-41]